MKNLKKVLAFTLALAMVLSTMTTTFAADETVDKLSNLGLLLNTSEQEVNAELTRSVGLAMVLKALGYTQEDSNAKAAENTFIDMGLAEWAKGFAKIGEELKITNGISVEPKMFAPTQKLDKKSFVTFMLRALGYDTNEAWEKAAALAQEAKLVEEQTLEDANFTKGEAAMIMYNALKATVQEDAQKRSLAQKLVDEGKLDKNAAIANGVIANDPDKLQIVNVSARNLIEIKVEFNAELDKASAQNAANYRVKARNVGSASLLEDGKTVLLTLEGERPALENKKPTTLVVSKVKTAKGLMIEKTSLTFTPYDDEYPKVEKIRYTGPRSLEITFSEPINEKPDTISNYRPVVTLKDGNKVYSTRLDHVEGNVAYMESYSSFKDGTDYVIGIGDPKQSNRYFFDYANYPNVYYEEKLTYTKDTTAPEAEITNVGQKWVKVVFNKPVTGLTPEHFYHSFAAYNPLGIYKTMRADDTNKVRPSDKVATVYLNFYDSNEKLKSHALPGGKVSFTALRTANKTNIRDNWGNLFNSTTVELEVVADKEAPQVVQVEAISKNEVKVYFDETVIVRDATFTLSSRAGSVSERLSGRSNKVSLVDKDNKVALLTFGKSYVGHTMVLTMKGVKDATLYENEMPEYSTEVDFTDKEWEGVRDVYYTSKVENGKTRHYLVVVFKEDMDDSALEAKNYKYVIGDHRTGTYYNFKEDGDFYLGRNDVVRFELDKSEGESVSAQLGKSSPNNKVELIVYREVKDLAGNQNPNRFQAENYVKKSSDRPTVQIKTAEAIAPNKIKLTFTEVLDNIDGREFKISDGIAGNNYRVDTYYSEIYKDNVILELSEGVYEDSSRTEKLYRYLTTGLENIQVSFDGPISKPNTRDIFENGLVRTPVSVTDKIAPHILRFENKQSVTAEDVRNFPYLTDYKETMQYEKTPVKAFNEGVKYDGLYFTDRDYSRDADKEAAAILTLEDGKYYIDLYYSEAIDPASVDRTDYRVNDMSGESVLVSAKTMAAQKGYYQGKTNIVRLELKTNKVNRDFLDELKVQQRDKVTDLASRDNAYTPDANEVWKVQVPSTIKTPKEGFKLFSYSFSGSPVESAFGGNYVTNNEDANNLPAAVLVKEGSDYFVKIAYAEDITDGFTTGSTKAQEDYSGGSNLTIADEKVTVESGNIAKIKVTITNPNDYFTNDKIKEFEVKQLKAVKDKANTPNVLVPANTTIKVFVAENVRKALTKLETFKYEATAGNFASAITAQNHIVNVQDADTKPVAVVTKDKENGKYYANLVFNVEVENKEVNTDDADAYFELEGNTSINIKAGEKLTVEGKLVKIELEGVQANWETEKAGLKIKQKSTKKLKVKVDSSEYAEADGSKEIYSMVNSVKLYGDDTTLTAN